MNNFNDDIITYISLFLTFKDILLYSQINKYYKNLFDLIFYKNLAIKLYTIDFWQKAYNRPINTSKPLKNIKEELIRIELFQEKLFKYCNYKFTIQDFYKYWCLIDII